MKAFVNPTGLHSRAMLRVADALKRHAPPHVEFVESPAQADFRVMHVIGHDSLNDLAAGQPYAMIQYCLRSSVNDWAPDHWLPAWNAAKLVWSYYDLPALAKTSSFNFYHSPLGVEKAFVTGGDIRHARDIHAMTSGFVSGPGAEAISEVAQAVDYLGANVLHLGPEYVDGMTFRSPRWKSVFGISDAELCDFYNRTRWVSCLRYVEGFEMPAVEGLMCGARPIVFDREDMRQWYEGHALFVPELYGIELVEALIQLIRYEPKPVTDTERAYLAARFNWATIACEFWEKLI